MPAKFVTTFLLSALTALSAGHAEAARVTGLSPAAESLIGRHVPMTGPNCINAALIGAGLVPTVIEILPFQAEKFIMPICFQETTAREGNIGAVLEKNGSITHFFYHVPKSDYVFTKNGPYKDAPFFIDTAQSAIKTYSDKNSRVAYYAYKPQPSCPIAPFNALLKSDKDFGAVAAELLKRTQDEDWNGEYSIERLETLYEKADLLRKSGSPSYILVKLMISAYGSSPLFKKALKDRRRRHAINDVSKNLDLPPQTIADKYALIDRAERQFEESIAKSPLANTTIARLAKKKMLRFDYWPNSKDDLGKITVQVMCPPEIQDRSDCSIERILRDLDHAGAFQVRSSNYAVGKPKSGNTMQIKVDKTVFSVSFGYVFMG